MTNAELRAAAVRIANRVARPGDVDRCVIHILATVHDDDRPHCPYTIVPMPINAAGQGPEMDPTKVIRTEWQVWDEMNRCVAVVPPDDDDEPVTVEKLTAWGGVARKHDVLHRLTFYRDEGLPISCVPVADGWKVVVEHAEYALADLVRWTDLVRCRNTAGQMRQTLEGLGIKLKGGA